jgi:alpha-tubulin suppressor-like RCC1 family protein
LGNGTTKNSVMAVQVGAATNWVKIWANLIENVGQQSDGSLWFWGWDYSRTQQGSSIPIPTRVCLDTNWVDVGLGDWMVFAIKTDGTLWAWGREAEVYTGASDLASNAIPMQVGTNSDWRACSSFSQWCPIFMKRDGSLWIMDASDHRRIKPASAYKPVQLRQIALQKEVVDFAGGRQGFGVALTAEGEVWTWGLVFAQHTRANIPLQWASRLLNRVGLPVQLGEPGAVTHKEPWQLRNIEPTGDERQ